MNKKIKRLRKELRDAQLRFEESLPKSPLEASLENVNNTNKSEASMRLPRLNRDRIKLHLKITESIEENASETEIKKLEEELHNVQAEIRAYKDGYRPSVRHKK